MASCQTSEMGPIAGSSESLTSEFNGHIFGSSSGEGNGPNGAWQAGISYDLSQTFTPTALGFAGSGQTTMSSFLVGSGFSSVSTGLPGNNLLVMFDNTTVTDFQFSGFVSDHAFITLQRHNGVEWESVFSTSTAGAFNYAGTLTLGNYYIRGIGDASANGNMMASSNWNYSFAAVPEPGSVVALTFGALALLRRRKR